MSFSYIISHGAITSPYIDGIGFTKDIVHSSFGPGVRKGYTIHFNIKGKGYFNSVPVEEGQGFLVYDGMYAHHYADKENPWELFWITISGDCSADVLDQYKADKKTNIFNFSSTDIVRDIAKKVCTLKEFSLDSLEMLEMFLKIHTNCITRKAVQPGKHSSEIYIDFATKYITDNIHRHITVEKLTEIIGVSQPYLHKIFTNHFGVSPKQYITKLKLDMSKSMLANSHTSITEIATSVGFPDVLTFSRFFSSKEKISPTKYRETH